jgi:hypothetical protein
MLNPSIKITLEILNLIAKIDEFKGEWKAIGNLAPDRLHALKHVATIESRIIGVRVELNLWLPPPNRPVKASISSRNRSLPTIMPLLVAFRICSNTVSLK